MKDSIKKRAAEIAEALNGQVSESYLKKAQDAGIESNSLPAKGKFGTFAISGKIDDKGTDFRHARMIVVDEQGNPTGDSVSLAILKAVAPLKGEPIEFAVVEKEGDYKGSKFLKGKMINPKFSQFSTTELIAHLEGKSFTASPVDIQVLRFVAGGHRGTDGEIKKAIVVKSAYQVDVEE